MRGVDGERDEDQENGNPREAVGLRGGEDDDRFDEIENGGDGGAAALENGVRNDAGRQRAEHGDQGDPVGHPGEFGGSQGNVVHLLQVAGEPLVDALPYDARAKIGAGDDPD